MPLVSVVIPVYNGERFLAAAIESVRSQTLSDWELVVIDDGSRDGSLAIATGYVQIEARLRVVSQSNAGVAAARNLGAAETDPATPYLLFLDQDDILEADALETLVRALQADPEAAGAHGYARDIDAHGCWLPNSVENALHVRLGLRGRRVVGWPINAPTGFAVTSLRCPFPSTGVVLLRRTAFDRAGGFDAYVTPADDWDLWLRLTRSRQIAFVPSYVLRYRWHDANVSHRAAMVSRGMDRCWRKHLAGPGLSKTQRAMMWRAYQRYHWLVCRVRIQWVGGELRRMHGIGAFKQLRHALGEIVHFAGSLARRMPAVPS